jgi:hypothetical protein
MSSPEIWQKDDGGMITQMGFVLLQDRDTVLVNPQFVDEFGLNREDGEEITDPLQERFVWEFPVTKVREAFESAGWTRAPA